MNESTGYMVISDGIAVMVEEIASTAYKCTLTSYFPDLSLNMVGTYKSLNQFYNDVKKTLRPYSLMPDKKAAILKSVRTQLGITYD